MKKLTFLEATATIMGAGVGGGIMAVPYLAAQSGYLSFLIILVLSYGLNLWLHLMLVEVYFRHGRNVQIVELMRTYVFKGRAGSWFLWAFFLFIVLTFVASLTAYISGAGEIISVLTGIDLRASRLLVYALAAGIVFFGLKAVGVSEKIAFYGIFVLIAVIVFGSLKSPFHLKTMLKSGGKEALALYGMVMYSLFSFFSVPQAVKGLANNRKKVVLAVVAGLGMNCLLVFTITTLAMGISPRVTKIAILGIAEAIGAAAGVAGSLFIILAMLTTYWSMSLALSDIILERTGMRFAQAWLIATAPTLVLIAVGRLDFLDYLKIAGGATALLIVFITLPLYLSAKKSGPVKDPAWTLGVLGHPTLLAVLFVLVILMAVGSLFGVNV